MRRCSLLLFLLLLAALPAAAQSHDDSERGTAGVYFDYTRLQAIPVNLFGVGGRVGINVHKHFAVEGELAYDFHGDATSRSCFGSGCAFGIFNVTNTHAHVLHGLFGLKVQTAGRHLRLFGEVKGGFLHIATDTTLTEEGNPVFIPVSFSSSQTHGTLFPGGGLEFLKQRWGLRAEAGDEIFWIGGPHHNLKLMTGPEFRF
jgi:hypothetical protein